MVDSVPMKFDFGARAGRGALMIVALATGSIALAALAGCRADAGSHGDATEVADARRPASPRDTVSDTAAVVHPWTPRPIVVAPDPALIRARLAADSLRADSLRAASLRADSSGTDSLIKAQAVSPGPARTSPAGKPSRKRRPGERRPYELSPADSARWPVKGPEPLPGALLPEHRIVAYYGNPKSTRMGVLGQFPPAEMLPRLERTATEWARAEPGRKVLPALHVIVTVAQEKPGPGGKYRLRHSDRTIEQVLGWAEERGWIVFLDVQTGLSTVADELPHLLKYLERPYVHLALDPEFAMTKGGIPGRRIGTLDASDLNQAVQVLADLVEKQRLPPKILVVHRFTQGMLTNHAQIRRDPRVQVVIDMDGFGAPWLKEDAYKFFIVSEPVQYTGFKLFYKNDKPMMTPEQVIGLWPSPLYIQYQ